MSKLTLPCPPGAHMPEGESRGQAPLAFFDWNFFNSEPWKKSSFHGFIEMLNQTVVTASWRSGFNKLQLQDTEHLTLSYIIKA